MKADPQGEDDATLKQHIEKNRKGDMQLAQKPGIRPTRQSEAGNPETPDNVEGAEENRSRRPDPDETYRQGKQGPK